MQATYDVSRAVCPYVAAAERHVEPINVLFSQGRPDRKPCKPCNQSFGGLQKTRVALHLQSNLIVGDR